MRRMVLVGLVAATACGGTEGPLPEISGERIEEHTRALSADRFGGRSPGTPGGDAAAEYVAQAFADAGLQPVAGSHFQSVPMIGSTPLAASMELAFHTTSGESIPVDPEFADRLTPADLEARFEPDYLDDYVMWSGDPEAAEAAGRGELVFVGYGVNAPENDWNDYGMDVAGKIVLMLVNDPPAPPGEARLFGGRAMTYYGRWTYKFEEAARQGALGAFLIHTDESAGYPWSVVRGGWSGEQFALPPDPAGPRPVALQGWMSFASAHSMLDQAGFDLDRLIEQAGRRGFTPVATGIDVEGRLRSRVRRVETPNVVGLLPGSTRPDEIVTVTSHYDHLGIGEAIDGDSIYNGAYDNASGTAMLIATAHAFGEMETPPDRSLLFIATAAEEQGLLGAAWYVQQPLFPLAQTVAEINVDGANLWGETDDMIVMGEERNGLGAFVRARAEEMGLVLRPDAEPEKGFFFRSDHFPFAKAGVPSLYIEHGRSFRGKPAGWGDRLLEEYNASRYHGPDDEYSEEFVYDGAVQHGRLLFLTALDIARSDAWPTWNEGSEFRAARDAQRPGG